MPDFFHDLARTPWLGTLGRQLFHAVLVGIGAGVGAVLFHLLLQLITSVIQQCVLGFSPPEALGEPPLFHFSPTSPHPALFLIVPAFGAVVSGLIVQRWAPEAAGHGTDAAIDSYHNRDGWIRPAVPPVKAITAAITIGTGGSGGREGPIAQIGAGIGSWLGRRLELSHAQCRVLMAVGMGAGVGAIFRAPLAGALFAGEILYSSAQIEHEVLVPSILASITAFSIFSMVFGWDPLFRVPPLAFEDPREMILYTALAVAVALAGVVFVRVFYKLETLFHRLPGPAWVRPLLGGLLTGLVAWFVPAASFTGYGDIQEALLGHHSAKTLFLLAILRILTTSFSIGSGGSGGVFGPSMVIGGCLGGSLGMIFYQTWPDLVPNPAAFVVVGMAGFFGGIAHAPISTVIMVSEMTGSYRLLVPSLWVCAISFLLTQRTSLYRKQARSWKETGAHQRELMAALLQQYQVADVAHRGIHAVARGSTAAEAARSLGSDEHLLVVVTDESGRAIGTIESALLREAAANPEGLGARKVEELHPRPVESIALGGALAEAAELLATPGTHLLVVLDTEKGSPVGVLDRKDMLDIYQREIGRRLELQDPVE